MLKSTDEEIKNEVNTNNPAPETGVVDIDMASVKKKRFRINGDNNKILELNPSDLGIVTRLSELYPKLKELGDKAAVIGLDDPEASDDPEEFKAQMEKLGAQFKEIDAGMRDYVDQLFQSNVSEVCASDGNMFDIINGKFRYDDIIDTLARLYNENISQETQALRARLAKKTEKYVTQDRKRSTKRSK